MSYELTPAYGRDYTKKADVLLAFQQGKDFHGDYQMGFALCNIQDFKPGETVLLRYKGNRQVTSYKIPSQKG
jgi:hypothetical protein